MCQRYLGLANFVPLQCVAIIKQVNLKYKKALSSVEYKLDPSVATIVIYEKVSEEKEVNFEVINKDKVSSKLMIEGVTLSAEKVLFFLPVYDIMS